MQKARVRILRAGEAATEDIRVAAEGQTAAKAPTANLKMEHCAVMIPAMEAAEG
jgi:hypothetical protein